MIPDNSYEATVGWRLNSLSTYKKLGVTPIPEMVLMSCTLFSIAWVSGQFMWALLGTASSCLQLTCAEMYAGVVLKECYVYY